MSIEVRAIEVTESKIGERGERVREYGENSTAMSMLSLGLPREAVGDTNADGSNGGQVGASSIQQEAANRAIRQSSSPWHEERSCSGSISRRKCPFTSEFLFRHNESADNDEMPVLCWVGMQLLVEVGGWGYAAADRS